MKARLAVLVSGTGRHLENFALLCERGQLDAEIGLVIASQTGIAALDQAKRFNIFNFVLDGERNLEAAALSKAVFQAVEASQCNTVVLAGYLRKLVIPETWARRVINIHPSLLPAFGGKGFYGNRVHKAVLERGCEFSGCTVHYVDNEYDNGPVIHQRCVEVRKSDDVESLSARVFAEELLAFPVGLKRHLADG